MLNDILPERAALEQQLAVIDARILDIVTSQDLRLREQESIIQEQDAVIARLREELTAIRMAVLDGVPEWVSS